MKKYLKTVTAASLFFLSAASGTALAQETAAITYSLVPHMIISKDKTPLLRIYKNGKVLIHYPEYSPKAGDYETELSTGEMQSLLNMVKEKGLSSFDANDVAAKRKNAKKDKETATGVTHEVSEVDETIIEVNLDQNDIAAGENVHKKISWNNLSSDIELYPQISELKKMAEAEKMLREILNRTDLRKL